VQSALPLEHVSILLREGVARLKASELRGVTTTTYAASPKATTRLTGGVGLVFERAALDVGVVRGWRCTIELRVRF
jgi:hypothetical protein